MEPEETKTLLQRVGEIRTSIQALIADAESDGINEDFIASVKQADEELDNAESYGTNTADDESTDEE